MATAFKRGGKANRHGYYVSWTDCHGKRKTKSAKTSDKATAERIGEKRETDAAARRDGLIDATQERFAVEGRRPLAEHVADFERFLQDKDNTPKHVRMTCQHMRWILTTAEAVQIPDLTGPAAMRAIGTLRADGASLRTCNAYLTSGKAFTRWLWEHKRATSDALCGLESFNAETDRRHVRRELTPEELVYLLGFVEGYTTPNHNLTGPDRSMVYRLAVSTGLRASELRSLTPESFDLDAEQPAVAVGAAYSKRRRKDLQPIRRDVAELLRPWLVGRPVGVSVFGDLPDSTARMLRLDLAAARADWIDDGKTEAEREQRQRSDFLQYENMAGEVADFHATRHTYISGIVAGGASVKTCQELARHSTPVLTIGRYSHTRLHDLTGALDALPDLQPLKPTPQALQATGTDGNCRSAGPEAQRVAQQTARDAVRIHTTPCDEATDRQETQSSPKSSNFADLGDDVRRCADRCEQRRRWELNPRWRICNPLP